MSRWDDIKNNKITTKSGDDNSNLSRWEKIKRNTTSISPDVGDTYKSFVSDYESFMNSGYDEETASDLKRRITDLRVKLNLNREGLSDEEKELETYLNKVKFSIQDYKNVVSQEYIDTSYESEEGRLGWQKYLEDQEKSKQEAETMEEGKTWWEKLLGYLGDTQDTTLPMATTTEVVKDLREDDSYKLPTDDWKAGQKYKFGELYLSNPEEAYKYAIEVNNSINKAKEEAQIKDIQASATDNAWAGAGHTAGALAGGMLGLTDFLSDLSYAAAGRETTDDGIISPYEYSQAVTGGIGEHLNEEYGTIDESVPIVGGKGWGDVYGVGYSIADSAISAYTLGGAGTLVSYFGKGAAAGVDDAKARGASDGQALLYGTALGVFEGLAEKIGVDNLFKLSSSAALKEMIKNVLKQAGAEGIEEGLTSLLGNIADNVIMQDKSNFDAMVLMYMSQGMTEEEAKKQAWMDSVEDIAFDTIAGAVSGGVHAGAHTIGSSAISNFKAKRTYGDGAALVKEALQVAPNNAFAQDMYVKSELGNALSGREINLLNEAIVNADRESIRKAVLKRLGDLGETSDVTPIADALVKQALGENLTLKEQKLLNDNNNAHIIASEMNPENIASGGLGNDWASKIGTRRIDPKSYNKDLYELASKLSGLREDDEKASVARTIAESDTATGTKLEVSESGHTSYTDAKGNTRDVKIKKVASTEGGLKIELEGGITVDATDLSFSSAEEAQMYEMVARMEVSTDTANEIINTFKPTNVKQALQYMQYVPLAYEYGKIGHESGLKNLNLPDKARRMVYNRGRADAITQVKAQPTATKKAKADKAVSTKKNGIIYEKGFTYDEASANELQKASMAGIEAISKMSSLEVHVFKSKMEGKERVYYLNGQRKLAPNGFFTDGNKIYIDFEAGNLGEGAMLYTMSHEVTHYIRKWNAKGFKELGDFLIAEYGKKGVDVQGLIRDQQKKIRDRYKREKKTLPGDAKLFDMAYEELVADAMSDMFTDPRAYEKLAKLKQQNRTLWQKLGEAIKALLDKLKSALGIYKSEKGKIAVAQEALEVRGFSADVYNKLQDLYLKAFVEADANYEASNASDLVELDTNTDSVSPTFSERTWTASEYVIHRDQMAEKIAKALDVSVQKAKSYIDDINSIAKMIADDRTRLDYEASTFGSAFVSNVEYGGSFDYTTLCKKRRIYTGTFTEIQKRLKDVALSPDDILTIRNLLIEEGIEATCGLCYVEGSRANMGKFAKEFIRLYKRDNPNAWIPNMADVNTPDGVEQMRISHPEAYDQYVYFWNHYGKLRDSDSALFASQQKPKLYEARKEYKGEILEHFEDVSTVDKKNRNGGIRMQSFSDFEIVHLIDTMQVIMDMSTVGLAGQAYTKVPEFAKAFGNTGLKINLSLIAKGVDVDGNLIFDDREGMPHETAFELRDKYSKNVGTIIVTFTDEQLLAAMADPRIDFIIPFHRSQWKKGQYGAMGLPKGTKDYTYMQNEKFIKKTYHEYRGRMVLDKASNYMPNEYWDFTKSGKENAEEYLKMCAENNKRPKFYKLLDYDGKGTYSLKADGSTDGYWKLLIDFKMYDNDGIGSPQEAVTPTFNMNEAVVMLDEYKGGHASYPVAHSVVDKFVKEYENKSETKFSDRDSLGNELSAEQQEFFKDSKIRDAEGNLLVVYHGSPSEFTEFKHSKIGGHGTSLGKGFYFTEDINLASSFYRDGGQLLKGYLNITKPLVNGKKTIKRAELEKLIRAVCEVEAKYLVDVDGYNTLAEAMRDTFISNYVNTYEMPLASAYRKVAELVYLDCDNDSDIIGDLINAGGGASRVLGQVRKVLGYDGVIFEHPDGVHEFVAFESNQFKNTTNTAPTSDPDIRYSERETLAEASAKLATISNEDYLRDKEQTPFVLVMENTPQIILDSMEGSKDRKVLIRRDALYLAIRESGVQDGHYHGLGAQTLADLPKYLEHPDAILATINPDTNKENESRRLVLTHIPTKNGQAIISVEFESLKDFEGEREYFNMVITVFDLHENYLKRLFNKFKATIKHEKEDLAQVNPQLYKWLRSINAKSSGNRISQDSEIVNREISEDDEKLSDRDPNAVSNRTLLANALESTVGEEGEGRNIIRNYKTNLHLIESEQLKLNEVREQIDEITYKKSLTVDGKKLSIAEFQNEARNLAKKQGKNPDEIKFTLDRDNSSYRASIGGEELMVAHKEFRSREDMDKLQVLYQEARSITTRITAYDKELLRLESMKPIKDVLNREKAKLRKRLEQKGKEAIRAQKEQAAKTQREIITRYQESRKNAIESRHRTAMREKIKNVVSDLNKLLLHPTKDQHVPIGLQGVVAEALDAINMDTMNAEERVAYYNDLIAKSSDPDEIEALTKKRDFFEYRDANFKERITALKNAYAEFKESDDPLIRNAHNDAIEDLIKNTADVVGKKSLKDMSLEQLEAVHNMYKAILATVKNSNKLFKEGRQETVTDNSEAVKTEVREVGGHQDRVLKISKFFKKFGWNMLKPVTAMKVIGSKTFAKLFDNVRAAEDTWAVDVSEAKQFYESVSAKYGFKKWDFKKRYTFKDSTGADFSLSLEQIMSLYAYSKRAQADKHLEFGGFIFDDAIEVVEKDKLGIPHKYEVNDANPYRLRKEDLLAVTEALTKEQKGFIDEMQTYLSDVMGAKGNEVSLAMYDIKLYNEKDYFPLKTSRYFREFDPEKSGSPKIKNAGFSKKTVPQAGNPIVLANFMDVWAQHVNDMSMYHAFVLPLEDFMRVYNYSSTAGGYDSVQQYIKNAYGSEANQYIERLMDDLNGGARVDSTADIMSKGLALFKKASVFASASVVIQQPSAIARALAYINPKYFVTSTPSAMNLAKHKAMWAELKKYAPVAVIKEMGYFDTGVGRSTVDWIKGNQTIKDKVDDVLSKAPAIADELCWTHIWEAVKRETKATTNLKEGSEEFLKKCGTRFTEVITNTQVYDSVLSRSGHMRSKDTGMKMATAFMAEPTTTLNMMVDGIIQGKRGNLKFTAATVGAISSSIILNSLLVSLVYAARDDDEDETYLEKYLASLTTELLDGFNPLTYIPLVKDAWAVLQGFDVERADMTLITKLTDSLQQMVKVFAKDTDDMDKDELDEYYKEVNESVLSILDNISSLVGIPLKNIRRDFNAVINIGEIIGRADKTTANSLGDTLSESVQNSVPVWGWLPDEQKSDKLYGAIVSGDTAYAERLKKTYKTTDAYESAVRKALRENDSRIHEAAQARIDGDISEYTRIAREIIAEGYFSQDTVVGAINSEISAINKGESSGEETEEKDEATSIYKASDINTAFDNGDTNLALTIIDDLIETKVANGMERDKAKSSVRSSMTSYWKPLYKAAYQSGNTTEMERIRRILYSSGLYGKANEVVKTVNNWLKD